MYRHTCAQCRLRSASTSAHWQSDQTFLLSACRKAIHRVHRCLARLHNSHGYSLIVERCGAVVKRRTRDREVPGSIPTNCKCCFLEQKTLSTLLSTGFYPGKKRATWKISTRLLNVLPSINKVDYYYYYYYISDMNRFYMASQCRLKIKHCS